VQKAINDLMMSNSASVKTGDSIVGAFSGPPLTVPIWNATGDGFDPSVISYDPSWPGLIIAGDAEVDGNFNAVNVDADDLVSGDRLDIGSGSLVAGGTLVDGGTPRLLTGTVAFPATVTLPTDAIQFVLTSAAITSSKNQQGLAVYINDGGGTVSKPIFAVFGRQNVPYSGTANIDFAGLTAGVAGQYTADGGSLGVGIAALAKSAGGAANTNLYGILGVLQGGGTYGAAIIGYDRALSNSAAIAGITASSSVAVTLEQAAGLFDNTSNTSPILVCRDNGISVFKIADAGDIQIGRTITPAGTTGNQTINKAAGTVNIAAAGTTVTVTNSLVTANSIIELGLRTNDATAWIKNYVPAAGSFVINLGAPATAEVSIGFVVKN
jgi:hypothetical protein